MAYSHSNSNHQRTPNKPTSLALRQQQQLQDLDNNNPMMGNNRGGYLGAPTSSNNEEDNWHEQPLNLDSFDLIEFISQDSTTPLDEMPPDDVQQQKDEAQYTQVQYQWAFSDRDYGLPQQQEHDYLSNEFAASVPSYELGGGAGGPMEMDFYNKDGEEEELKTPPRLAPLTAATTSSSNFVMANQNLDHLQRTTTAMVPSTSRSSLVQQLSRMVKPDSSVVKQEPTEQVRIMEEENEEEGPLAPPPSPASFQPEEFTGSTTSRASSVTSGGMAITTIRMSGGGGTSSTASGGRRQPRRYRIKPESEKANPMYRKKREKNNDAVRRSREKSKMEQMKKEARLQELENQIRDQAQFIAELEVQNVELRQENLRLKQQCRCGGIGGKHSRR